VRAVRVATRVVAVQRPVTRFVRVPRAVPARCCGPIHVERLPSARARDYLIAIMKAFGRCVSVIAAFTVAPAFRRLRTDLVSVYSAYRASLRSRIPDVLVTTLIVATVSYQISSGRRKGRSHEFSTIIPFMPPSA